MIVRKHRWRRLLGFIWLFSAAACVSCQRNSEKAPTADVARVELESPRPKPPAEKAPRGQTTTSLPSVRFRDVAQSQGIDFFYDRGETGEFWPCEPTGGGAAWIDVDLDGRQDLVFVGGAQLPVDPDARFVSTRIFRNGTESFEDVTAAAGVLSRDYGQGIAVADFDNDGAPDFLVTNLESCVLYRNNNDGTFQEQPLRFGEWNTGATFVDLDRDGVLDLYVGGYFHFEREGYVSCSQSDGTPQYCGPSNAPFLPDSLYRGDGNGGFVDVSSAFGSAPPKGPAFGAVAADLDGDGWPDLYVANDAAPNFLWHNRTAETNGREIRLEDVAFESGAAVNADGLHQASMGIACADVDGNGRLDIALSHFTFDYCTLYGNGGGLDFLDVTARWGLAAPTMPTMGWGMGFLDYDNDGWLDLFIVNGHINRTGRVSEPYEMRPHLFQNRDGKRFVERTDVETDDYLRQAVIARGAAFSDFDHDGRIDVAVGHHHRPAALVRNESETIGTFVSFELVGRISNRDAINAKLKLWVAMEATGEDAADSIQERTLFREIVSGDSYLSSNDRRIHVGLGPGGRVLRGEVTWPSGIVSTFGSIETDRRWLLVEGQVDSAITPAPLP